MSIEKPGKGRARIDDKGYELEVSIPTKKNPFLIIFMCTWLVGWAFFEVMGLTQMLPAVSKIKDMGTVEVLGIYGFTIFWLIGWTVGGVAAMSVVAWNIAGREIVTLSPNLLKIEKRVFSFSRVKQYSLSDAENFRKNSPFDSSSFSNWLNWWRPSGGISFDYGMKTVTFARGLDDAELNYILGLFKQKGARVF